MPTILRRLPFYDDATTLRIPGGPALEIPHDQIVVWVSIAPANQAAWMGSTQRFPAPLDIGFNASFLVRDDHLGQRVKGQLDEKNFPLLRAMTVDGQNVPAFEADLWLYPNVAGFRDQITDAPPLRVELSRRNNRLSIVHDSISTAAARHGRIAQKSLAFARQW